MKAPEEPSGFVVKKGQDCQKATGGKSTAAIRNPNGDLPFLMLLT